MKPRSRRSLRGSARKKPDIVVTNPGEKTGRRLAHHDHLKSTTQLTVVKVKPNSLLQRLKFASPSVGKRRIARKETKKMHHLSVDTLATTVSEDSDQGGGCSVDVASKKKPLNVFDLSIETLISMNKPS
uniref:Uncharacterized protein n=1 Tax=Ciona savignyi TaxID=51511 RepID=H2ZDB7_CIOSA